MDNTQLGNAGQPGGQDGPNQENDLNPASHDNVFDEGAIHAAKRPADQNSEAQTFELPKDHASDDFAKAMLAHDSAPGVPPRKPFNYKMLIGALSGVFVIVLVVYVSFTGGFRQLLGDVTVPSDDDDGDGFTNETELAIGKSVSIVI